VFGEREGVVRDLRRLEIHGSPYVDLTVAYEGNVLETARLGTESIPEDLQVGERVTVSRAVNMIVSIRRP
jgi:hypothetical protein